MLLGERQICFLCCRRKLLSVVISNNLHLLLLRLHSFLSQLLWLNCSMFSNWCHGCGHIHLKEIILAVL